MEQDKEEEITDQLQNVEQEAEIIKEQEVPNLSSPAVHDAEPYFTLVDAQDEFRNVCTSVSFNHQT